MGKGKKEKKSSPMNVALTELQRDASRTREKKKEKT